MRLMCTDTVPYESCVLIQLHMRLMCTDTVHMRLISTDTVTYETYVYWYSYIWDLCVLIQLHMRLMCTDTVTYETVMYWYSYIWDLWVLMQVSLVFQSWIEEDLAERENMIHGLEELRKNSRRSTANSQNGIPLT
jgi:hypothetical protein